jgi:hypothetical protein
VTTGTDNTLVGYEAGLGVTGNGNIIVGEDTSSAITTGGSNILIGNTVSYGLTNTASNQINIGNTIYGNLHAASGGTALTIGSTGHDGAIMTFAGDGGIVLPSGSTAQRPGASVANGMIRYNSDSSGAVEAYINGAWDTLLTSAGSTSGVNLGTSATATNPSRSGQLGTGVFSAASNTVSVAANGSDVADFTTTGESVTGSVTASTSVISPIYTGSGAIAIKPGSDSTSAVQIQTNGGTNILDVDTTNSRVGIGTTAPSRTLDVLGNGGNPAARFEYPSGVGAIEITGNSASSADVHFGTNASPVLGAIYYDLSTNSLRFQTNSVAARVIIDSSGNVGIGTATPGGTLDVEGSGGIVLNAGNVAVGTTSVPTFGAYGTALLYVNGLFGMPSSNASQMLYLKPNSNTQWILGNSSVGAIMAFNTSNVVTEYQNFSINGFSKFSRIDGSLSIGTTAAAPSSGLIVSGNVGIGNTSPGAKLDVGLAGTTLGTMRLEGNTSGYVQIQPTAAAGSWTLTLPSSAGTANYVLQTDGSGNTSWVNLGGSGTALNLGTSASATNPQRSGQAGTGLFSATSNTVSIADAGSDVMDVAATGPNILGTISQGSYSIGYQINGNNAVWQDATNYNLAVGATALPTTVAQGGSNYGQNDVALGYQALNANTTGYKNTAVGSGALAVNTTGTQNTAVGYQALNANIIGNWNAAVGYKALSANTASNNTAMGAFALSSDTSGGSSVAVGYQALTANTTGYDNTAVGFAALDANITGFSNVAVGYQALDQNVTGNLNTAIGTMQSIFSPAARP